MDSGIRITRRENAGAGGARNNGLQYAAGTYLSILDSDDFYESTMLERSYNAALTYDADIVSFGCDSYDNNTGVYSPCTYSIHKNLLSKQRPFASTDVEKDIFKLFGWAWDKLFKRSFVEETSYSPGTAYFQRHAARFQCRGKAQRMITLEEDVLVHHRKETGVSLSVSREESWMCFYNALLSLRQQLIDWNLHHRFEKDFVNLFSIHLSLANLNTVAEPTHTLLYNKLRNEWFKELGVVGHTAGYFYKKYEFGEYEKIMKTAARLGSPAKTADLFDTERLKQISNELHCLLKICLNSNQLPKRMETFPWQQVHQKFL
jgi:glycosyltransferase involved in cell wall biosynthesis